MLDPLFHTSVFLVSSIEVTHTCRKVHTLHTYAMSSQSGPIRVLANEPMKAQSSQLSCPFCPQSLCGAPCPWLTQACAASSGPGAGPGGGHGLIHLCGNPARWALLGLRFLSSDAARASSQGQVSSEMACNCCAFPCRVVS